VQGGRRELLRQDSGEGTEQFRIHMILLNPTGKKDSVGLGDKGSGSPSRFNSIAAAAIVKVLPAPTTWSSNVLGDCNIRQTLVFDAGTIGLSKRSSVRRNSHL
jgi:hypothetical protein